MDDLIDLLKSDSNAANAFGALASAVSAILALFVSVVSVYLSCSFARRQRRQLSLVGLYKGTIFTAGEANKNEDVGALGACVDMSICWTHDIASLRPL